MKRIRSTEENLYRLGLWLLPVFFFAWLAVRLFGSELISLFPACWVRESTGLFCPGCGATRAVLALSRFHFLACFCYHPFVAYAAVVYPSFLVWESLHRRVKLPAFPVLPAFWIGFAILLFQFFWKNAALFCGWNPYFWL